MRRARFSLAVGFLKAAIVFLGTACLATCPVSGQEPQARTSPPPGRPADQAREPIKREAEANIKQREAIFARLKAVQGPPAQRLEVVPFQVEMGPLPAERQVVRANFPIMALEEVPANDDSDEDAPPQQIQVFTEHAFDAVVFDGAGNQEAFRARLDSLLKVRIATLEHAQSLTRGEREKLQLAGRADIKRVFAELEAKRQEFEGVRRDRLRAREFLGKLTEFRVQRSIAFYDGSLFAKVLATIIREKAKGPGQRADKPLPGSAVTLKEAVKRADLIVVGGRLNVFHTAEGPADLITAARTMNVLKLVDFKDRFIISATTEIGRPLKGNVALGTIVLNAISMSHSESLPADDPAEGYLLFIERARSDGLNSLKVIKMLRATEPNLVAVMRHMKP